MQAGFAISDITPALGIYLTGYGQPERLAEQIHSPLNATAMVLNDGDRTVAVVSLDWCFVDWELTGYIRKGVSEASGIPEKNILLSCTHTHSAPHTTVMRTLGRLTIDPEQKGVQYAKDAIPAIADAVCRAKNSMRTVEAGFAAGKTETGVSRRGMNEHGVVIKFIADPDAMYDGNMTVVHFRDSESGKDLGIFIHCSAHNTSMGSSRIISSDWCGVMRKRVGMHYDCPVIFLNGAIGDVGPRSNRYLEFPMISGYSAGGGDGVCTAEEVGYRAATDALQLLYNIRDFRKDLPLKVSTSDIVMPQELPMTEAEAKKIMDEFGEETAKLTDPPLEYQLARAMWESWQGTPEPEFRFEQTLVAFGPLALAPFPFEMFSIFSLRLRKYGPSEYTLLCGNTNGRYGYMPDRGAIAYGGYEVTSRKNVRNYVLKPEAGDLAIEQTLEALRNLN